jgi:hypothetical protein
MHAQPAPGEPRRHCARAIHESIHETVEGGGSRDVLLEHQVEASLLRIADPRGQIGCGADAQGLGPFERMVLIPCSDDWAAVARLEPDLAARFPASVAPAETLDICLDKGRFAGTLASLGLPHPRTICLEASDDAWALSRTLRDPFVKPRNSLAFRTRYRQSFEAWAQGCPPSVQVRMPAAVGGATASTRRSSRLHLQ